MTKLMLTFILYRGGAFALGLASVPVFDLYANISAWSYVLGTLLLGALLGVYIGPLTWWMAIQLPGECDDGNVCDDICDDHDVRDVCGMYDVRVQTFTPATSQWGRRTTRRRWLQVLVLRQRPRSSNTLDPERA